MSFTRFAALTVVALVLSGAAANAGGPLRPFRYGFWSGGAYTDERTGAFTHCSAGVAYDSGVNLFVLVTPQYRWWLGFINPKWSLAPNAKTLIRLRLDSGTPFDRPATVPNGQLLLVSLPENSHLIEAFRHGSQLALDTGGQAFFFKLNATPGMMDRLTACVRTSLALEDTTSPSGVQSPSVPPSPTKTPETAVRDRTLQQSLPPPPGDASSAVPALSAAISSTVPQKSVEHIVAASAKPAASAAAFQAAPRQSATASPAPSGLAGSAATPTTAAQKSAAGMSGGLPPPGTPSAHAGSSAAENASSPDAAFGEPRAASAANSPAPRSAVATPPAALSPTAADGASQSAGGPSTRSIAALPPPVSAAANNPEATPQTMPPPLSFTAVNPITPPAPPVPALGPVSATALEEIRLAAQFLSSARLPDAHLIVAGKPAALADFAAVWRSEDAAGAVKIIPPGPDVSAIAIASNLIAVDPQVCKGDFTSARLRTHVGDRVVLSAVLTCNEANEERVTEYFIAPRQRGGFVVFAVIRSNEAEQGRDLGRQNLEALSRAAIQAVAGQG